MNDNNLDRLWSELYEAIRESEHLGDAARLVPEFRAKLEAALEHGHSRFDCDKCDELFQMGYDAGYEYDY